MRRKDLWTLVGVGLVTAVIAWVASGIIFKSPLKNAQAPTAAAITSTFPDIKNDPNYKSIFNAQALDPTQPIQIGGSSNNGPFNSQ